MRAHIFRWFQEGEEWRVRYESLRAQLGDFAQLRAEHEALSAQFAAISSLAVAAAVDDKTKTNVSTSIYFHITT